MTRKPDKKLNDLKAKRDKAQADFDRWIGRVIRATNRLNKAKKTLARLNKQVDGYDPDASAKKAAEKMADNLIERYANG